MISHKEYGFLLEIFVLSNSLRIVLRRVLRSVYGVRYGMRYGVADQKDPWNYLIFKYINKHVSTKKRTPEGFISAIHNTNSRCALAYLLSLRGPAKALHQRAREARELGYHFPSRRQ